MFKVEIGNAKWASLPDVTLQYETLIEATTMIKDVIEHCSPDKRMFVKMYFEFGPEEKEESPVTETPESETGETNAHLDDTTTEPTSSNDVKKGNL